MGSQAKPLRTTVSFNFFNPNPPAREFLPSLSWKPRDKFSVSHHEHRDDEPEQSDGAAEDLHDEDLDEERGVRGVGEGGAGADLPDAEAAHQVHEAGGQAGAEHQVAGEPVADL